jgi:hypothetical protein
MSRFFQKRLQAVSAADTAQINAFQKLQAAVDGIVQAADDQHIGYAIGTEGFNNDKAKDVGHLVKRVEDGLRTLATELNIGTEGFAPAQIQAASSAAATIGAGHDGLRAFLARSFAAPKDIAGYDRQTNTVTTVVGMEGMADAFSERRVSVENFDDKDNRNAKVTSMSYNLNAAQQNEFGETFFPTVTISNDQVGIAVSIRLISVIKDFTRNADASLADFRRRNVVRALLDHTILKNDSNKLVPQHSAQTAQWFSTDIGPFARDVEGVSHNTGALVVNKEIGDLIRLGYPEATPHALNQGDTIDPAVGVGAVYAVIGASKVRLSLKAYKRAGFLAAPEDDSRLQNLNMALDTVTITPSMKQFNGADMGAELAVLKANKWTVQLRLNLSGSINVARGNGRVDVTEFSLVKIMDEDGETVDITAGDGKAIADAIKKEGIVGWDIEGRLSNLNRRQRGQIMDTTVYNQVWTVPLRSPITYPRPVNSTSETDAADLAVLVSTTHARTSNEAVTTLFEAADMFSEYATHVKHDLDAIPPERFGVTRLLVRPTYKTRTVDLTAIVNNQNSHEKEKDIAAEMMLQIKDVAYQMYRDSGFQAFVESGAAGVTGNPTILIGTDPYTSRFVFVPGDTRTVGPDFAFKVVTTPDERFQGNIVVAFGYPDLFKGEINPAHFGNMLWASETVLVLQMNRSGDAQKETTVQPRFRHIINVPVLGWLIVKGLPEVIAMRVPRSFLAVDKDGNPKP